MAVNTLRRPETPAHTPTGVFSRLAAVATARPRRVLAVWVLLALAAARLAVTVSSALSGAGWDAQGSTAQTVRQELRRDFPALGAEAAVVVYTQATPIATAGRPLPAWCIASPRRPAGHRSPTPLALPPEAGLIAPDGRTALVLVELDADDDAARPEAAGRVSRFVETVPLPDGASAEVTGEWPVWADFNDTNEEAPRKAELLSGLPTVILLVVVFGGIIAAGLPLILALAGVAVGFAALHRRYREFGIDHQGFVDAWAPLFFFALLFGLSMDYQLFLLAAIRERYEATGDTRAAVRDGIARTGRPITNAAAIMIIVFIAFGVTGPIPPTELGITLAVAVLLDATIVRMLLVPTAIGLLGTKNWYLPRWLDRTLPHIRFSH